MFPVKVATISMVKNECDIIELFVRINARWVTHFYIVDDSSSDATREILEKLEQEGYPLTVTTNTQGFDHGKVFTGLARQLSGMNEYDFIFPIDADEFINDPDSFFKALQGLPADSVGELDWVTMVPCTPDYSSFEAPLYENFQRRKQEIRQFSKLVFTNSKASVCTFVVGNHSTFINNERIRPVKLDCDLIHVPVRSKEQITLKALNGSHKKSVKRNRTPGESFHWDMMADMIRARNFSLQDDDFIDFAFAYSLKPEDTINREVAEYRLGRESDRIVYRNLATINVHKGLDDLIYSFTQSIRDQYVEIDRLHNIISRHDISDSAPDSSAKGILRFFKSMSEVRRLRYHVLSKILKGKKKQHYIRKLNSLSGSNC